MHDFSLSLFHFTVTLDNNKRIGWLHISGGLFVFQQQQALHQLPLILGVLALQYTRIAQQYDNGKWEY